MHGGGASRSPAPSAGRSSWEALRLAALLPNASSGIMVATERELLAVEAATTERHVGGARTNKENARPQRGGPKVPMDSLDVAVLTHPEGTKVSTRDATGEIHEIDRRLNALQEYLQVAKATG